MGPMLLAVVGLVLAYPVNMLIDRDAAPERYLLPSWAHRLLGGRALLAVLVPLLAGVLGWVLGDRYGLTLKSALLLAAVLVLLHTGAVDWRVRLIDTLVMVVGTVVLLAGATFSIGWKAAMLGAFFAGLAFVVIFIVAMIVFPSHSAPFGLGDVYLGIFIGALMGLKHLPGALFYGMLMAGLVAFGIILVRATGRETPVYISYGTYLCLGTILYLALWPI